MGKIPEQKFAEVLKVMKMPANQTYHNDVVGYVFLTPKHPLLEHEHSLVLLCQSKFMINIKEE